jgi:hypothetical protein
MERSRGLPPTRSVAAQPDRSDRGPGNASSLRERAGGGRGGGEGGTDQAVPGRPGGDS